MVTPRNAGIARRAPWNASRPEERPVANAMRTPVRAHGLAHELLVRLVVALEPAHSAVALEDQHVRRDAIQEPAVVADDHDASREVEQRLFERAQRVHVQIVRRLVEQEDVAARTKQLGQVDSVSLAAGEIADPFLLVGAAKSERRGVRARVARPGPDLDALLAAGDLLPDLLRRIQGIPGLRHVCELDRVADTQRPAIVRLLVREQPKERRLSRSVRPDDPDDPAARQREGEVVEEEPVAVRLAQSLRLHDQLAEPRSGRDRDLELALALVGIFGEKPLVGFDARLALGLPGAWGRAHPLELPRERSLPRRLLLLLDGEPPAFLVQPGAVVALVGDAESAVELEDPAGDVVEEVAVVRDRDDASRVLGEMTLEPGDGLGVEMVRGLVEEQEVRLGEEQPAERDPATLAAGERSDILIAWRAAERVHRDVDGRVEIPKTLRLDLVLGLLKLIAHPLHLRSRELLAQACRQRRVTVEDGALCRNALLDVPAHVLGWIEHRLLREQPGAVAVGDARVARVLPIDARHDAQERALPGAVRSEHPDLRVRIERQRDAAQDLALRERRDLAQLMDGEDELRRHLDTVTGRLCRRRGEVMWPTTSATSVFRRACARSGTSCAST